MLIFRNETDKYGVPFFEHFERRQYLSSNVSGQWRRFWSPVILYTLLLPSFMFDSPSIVVIYEF